MICVLIISVFTACVTTSYLESPTHQAPNLSSYNRILVKISSDIRAEREIQMIEALIVARLSKAKLFERVIAASRIKHSEEPLLLHAMIVDLRKVSSGKRVKWGVFAGNARVVLRVELIDQGKKKSLGKFVAGSSSFGGSFGKTTSDTTIDRIADEIVGYITRGKMQQP